MQNFSDFFKNSELKENTETPIDKNLEFSQNLNGLDDVFALNEVLDFLKNWYPHSFKVINEGEDFHNSNNHGTGVRVMNENGYQFRFNTDKEGNLKSIHYWDATNIEFNHPTSSATIFKYTNDIEFWRNLLDLLKKTAIGDYTFNQIGLIDIDPDDDIIFTISQGQKEKNTFIDYLMSDIKVDKDLIDEFKKMLSIYRLPRFIGNLAQLLKNTGFHNPCKTAYIYF